MKSRVQNGAMYYYHNLTNPLRKLQFKRKYGLGENVMDKSWDNLIILDACRYDKFNEVCDIKGDLSKVISLGSSSEEFFNKNFANGCYGDTVYTTANPYGAVIASDSFHKIKASFSGMNQKSPVEMKESEQVEKSDYINHIDNVNPEKVTNLAKDMCGDYPEKRHIIHYMQPHSPYLGEKAKNLREKLQSDEGIHFKTWELNNKLKSHRNVKSLLHAAQEGIITADQLSEVYTENLEIVLEHVKDLLETIDGKTVLTSDHGELLGEKCGMYKYNHYNNLYTPYLRVVPWLEIETNQRRSITEGKINENNSIDNDDVEEQLKALGYK